MMQPRDNHLDNDSDCADVQVLPIVNHDVQIDVSDDTNNKRVGRSRLAVTRSDSPTSSSSAMLASPLPGAQYSTSTDDADAANQQLQQLPVALVGARKRKAVRVVKHSQQVSFLPQIEFLEKLLTERNHK
jgi:hypothetical protein